MGAAVGWGGGLRGLGAAWCWLRVGRGPPRRAVLAGPVDGRGGGGGGAGARRAPAPALSVLQLPALPSPSVSLRHPTPPGGRPAVLPEAAQPPTPQPLEPAMGPRRGPYCPSLVFRDLLFPRNTIQVPSVLRESEIPPEPHPGKGRMTDPQPNPQLKPELSTPTIKISTRICAGGTNPLRPSFRAGGTQGYGNGRRPIP